MKIYDLKELSLKEVNRDNLKAFISKILVYNAMDFREIIIMLFEEFPKHRLEICECLAELGGKLELWDEKLLVVRDIIRERCELFHLTDFKVWLKHGTMIRKRVFDPTFLEIAGQDIVFLLEMFLGEKLEIDEKIVEKALLGLTKDDVDIIKKMYRIIIDSNKFVREEEFLVLESLKIKLYKRGLLSDETFSKKFVDGILKTEKTFSCKSAKFIIFIATFIKKLSLKNFKNLIYRLSKNINCIKSISEGILLSLLTHIFGSESFSGGIPISEGWNFLVEIFEMDSRDLADLLDMLHHRNYEKILDLFAIKLAKNIFLMGDDRKRFEVLVYLKKFSSKQPKKILVFLRDISSMLNDVKLLDKTFELLSEISKFLESDEQYELIKLLDEIRYHVEPRNMQRFFDEHLDKVEELLKSIKNSIVVEELSNLIKIYVPGRI